MRILITNDDGINAAGLAALTDIATAVAGPGGEVWTVAPAFEQSGVAHAISYTHPTMIAELGPRRFAAEGSPADCVLAGLHDVLRHSPPDLVLSGVNRGNNAAENAAYSGTLGGAMEGALNGLKAIALSQYFGPGNRDLADPYEAARVHGPELIRDLCALDGWHDGAYGLFYSINFPPCAAADVRGRRAARQGVRHGTGFGVVAHVSPAGRRFLWITGGDQHAPADPGTDAAVSMDGFISVTPMRADFTAHDALDRLAGRIDR
jgi:5'-nucleotidase